MRRLLIILVIAGASVYASASTCASQTGNYTCGVISGFPGNANTTGCYDKNGASQTCGTADTVYCWRGIPNDTAQGTPSRTPANFGSYASTTDNYTNFASSNATQRSLDICAPNGSSTPENHNPTLVVFPGGGNYHITGANGFPTSEGNTASWVVGPYFVILDPNQNNSTNGKNVIVASYQVNFQTILKQSVSAGGTSLCVATIDANHYWFANSEVASFTPTIGIEGEVVTASAQVAASGSCASAGGTYQITISALASNHSTTGVPVWAGDSTGNWTMDASKYDAVTLMNYIACGPGNNGVGIGDRHNINGFGQSNGGWLVSWLAHLTPTQKTYYRQHANAGSPNEWNCSVADDWVMVAVNDQDPPLDQRVVSVAATDGSEPAGNAYHFGQGVSGLINTTYTLWDTGYVGGGANYPLANCTSSGITPVGSWTTVANTAFTNSPMQMGATQWLESIGIGDIDANVTVPQAQCYAQIYGTPIVVANDCSGGHCNHGSCSTGGVGSTMYTPKACTQIFLKNIGTPDSTYGTTLAWNTTDLPHGTNGSAYSQSIAVTGGTSPYTYTVVNGSLSTFVGGGSTGLSLNSASGAITGTPGASGYIDFTVRACDSETPQICAVPDREFYLGIFPTFDTYGGLSGKYVPNNNSGYWQLKKVGKQWLWVSPSGNASFDLDIQNATYNALNSLGLSHYGTAASYYTNMKLQEFNWGFNSFGAFSSVPFFDGTDGNSSFIDLMRAYQYAVDNAGFCSGSHVILKTATASGTWAFGTSMNSTIVTASPPSGYYAGMVDVFDPEWTSCASTAANKVYTDISNLPTNKYMKGVGFDESDEWGWMGSTGTGAQTATVDMGYAALVGNPCTSQGTPNAVCGTGNPLWTKYALLTGVSGIDLGFGVGKGYLGNKYSTAGSPDISKLNTAWGTSYTTFGSAGGWSVGGIGSTGMLDENGVLTVGASGVSDPFTLASFCGGCHGATIKADLQAFDYYYAYKAYQPQVAALQALDTNHNVFFSINRYGANGSSPHTCAYGPQSNYILGFRDAIVNQSAQGVVVGCHDTGTSGAGSEAVNKAMYDAMCTQTSPAGVTGNCLPIESWLSVGSVNDSPFNGATSNYSNYATQALRGAAYASVMTDILAATGTNGDSYNIGMMWWALTDDHTQSANFGLITEGANPYNGNASIMPTGTDNHGVTQGGESGNYGQNEGSTFLGQVVQTNLGIANAIEALQILPTGQKQSSGKFTTSGNVIF